MAMEFMNNKQTQTPSWQWVLLIILFLAFSRLIPHPPNFTPLGAMALLAGANFKDLRIALIIPLVAMLISDALLGFHSSMLYVYCAVAIIILGSHLLIKRCTLLNMTVGAVTSAVVFFIVTNFGAWLSHDMYPHTLAGLQQAYIAGLPFFKNTLVSNLIFTAVGFFALRQLPNQQAAGS